MRRLISLFLCCFFLFFDSATAMDWEIIFKDNGTFIVNYKKQTLVDCQYVFWKENGAWAHADVSKQNNIITGTVADLGLNLEAKIVSKQPNVISLEWTIQANQNLSSIIGGGLEFHLARNSPVLNGASSNPTLLDNNKGWVWKALPGATIKLELDPAIPVVNFERGDPGTIRTYLIKDRLAVGSWKVKMTITLPIGGGIGVDPSTRYAKFNPQTWYKNAMTPAGVPVDISYLNEKPAGKHGYVRAKGESFEFEDGTPVRFWGANIAAYALFRTNAEIEAHAHRLAQLGFNLVRIHHHDSMHWVQPTVIQQGREDSRHLDEQAMDRVDYWIKCLKEQGIYVWLDLHVGRLFKAGDGNIPGINEILGTADGNGNGEVKGFCYFNTEIQRLMQEFNEKYLSHINSYTNIAYKDDPVIMGLLITNENDLTFHFGNLMLADKPNPSHRGMFLAAINQFSTESGLSAEDLERTWEPGPSKIFLNNQERLFNRVMIDHLRSMGVKNIIATTNSWSETPAYSLPSLTVGDAIDVHSYGEEEALSTNPKYSPNFLTYIGASHIANRPLAVTEWNVPYPRKDRFTSPMYIASIASLQGWGALMLYNYSQESMENSTMASEWSTFSDPAFCASMPAAALLYRQGHVAEAQHRYCLHLDQQNTFFTETGPKTSVAIRTLLEKSKLTIAFDAVNELPWLDDFSGTVPQNNFSDPNQDFIAENALEIKSDTAQLTRNWDKGIQTINTPKTQAVSGWLTGGTFRFDDVQIDAKAGKATIVVTALDNLPIDESKNILITAIAQAYAPNNTLPFYTEPVMGEVRIKGKDGLKLRALNADGKPQPMARSVQSVGGWYKIPLGGPSGTHWYQLSAGSN